MRLGNLIAKLEQHVEGAGHLPVRFVPVGDDVDGLGEYPGEFRSYRGYYERLAVGADGPLVTLAEFLGRARACIGATFHGYKGGEYRMTEHTLVHVANYGETSDNRIMGVEARGGYTALLIAHVEDW